MITRVEIKESPKKTMPDAIEVGKFVNMVPEAYAEAIYNLVEEFDIDIANKVNHSLFYSKVVSYEHFRTATWKLAEIIIRR